MSGGIVKSGPIPLLAIGLLFGSVAGVTAGEESASEREGTILPASAEPAEFTPARVIDLGAPDALFLPDVHPFPVFSCTQDGVRIEDIPVTPGETILFRLDNTSGGYTHNFYIGYDDELSEPRATTEIGITDWTDGIQELEWTVPDDITGLRFGCTFPSHNPWMQGTFSISP